LNLFERERYTYGINSPFSALQSYQLFLFCFAEREKVGESNKSDPGRKKKKRRPSLSLNRKKLDDRLNIKDERKTWGIVICFFFLCNNHHQKLVDDKTTATRITTI
jgi:hypothetical protein